MKKTLLLVAIGLILSVPVNAQFTMSLGKVSPSTSESGNSSSSTSTVTSLVSNDNLDVKHSAPCPWVMEKMHRSDFEDKVSAYVKELGTITNSKLVGDFKKALLLRAHEDSLEYDRLKPNFPQMNESQSLAYHNLENELEQYHAFLCALGDLTVLPAFVGKATLEGTIFDLEFESLRLWTTNSSVQVKYDGQDEKKYFYQGDDKVFLEEEDLTMAMNDVRRFFYVYYLLEGQKDPDLIKTAFTAKNCWIYGLEANDNNKPENITRYDAPQPGALNSISGAALASAKKSESYQNAAYVIIDADSWTIDRDGFGNIIRRRVGGWVIENTKYGKLAKRAQFAQNYDGGSYGATELYGIGGGRMYLK